MKRRWFTLTAGLIATAAPAAALGMDGPGREEPAASALASSQGGQGDSLKHPLGARQAERRQRATKERLAGHGSGRVQQIAGGQFVELEQTRSDRVFVILAEFGDEAHWYYGDPALNPGGDQPGPLHNQIPEPDRAVDNTTIWRPDFGQAHYEDLYFSAAPGADSMVNYYQAQSSGRYTIDGGVTEWVRVPYNAARYGHNLCGRSICSSTWYLVRDAINIWTEDQIAAGRTVDEIAAYLATFDVWDRYDHDSDGDFDEPDGYIDHFQIVHAGQGEETGGGAQGSNAIWSHRWYAFYSGGGHGGSGPADNPLGGTRFGPIDIWVGDYTIQPENGGLGVFAHEFGHDLGLPDHYDTTYAGENSSAFWTLMSHGSYLGDGTIDLGSRPGDMSAWDKLQLGWLDYDIAHAGQTSAHRLGPAEATTRAAQGLVTVLPPKEIIHEIAPPASGSFAWHSGIGDHLDHDMLRAVALPGAGAISLELQAFWDIEKDWDYAYVSVSTDGGATYTNLPGSVTTSANPNGQNLGNGITGSSGGWQPISFDLSPYAGQTILLRLRYWTDGAVQGLGFMADELRIVAGGAATFEDGAELAPNGWSLGGFKQSPGFDISLHEHYYVAEYRQRRGFDEGLETGPYNHSFVADGYPKMVEHFPYQEGLLISYWDTSMEDNNVGLHPGEGLILPIDARPEPFLRGDGHPWRTRVQVFDATFGLDWTDPLSLKFSGAPRTELPPSPPVPVFNDLDDYWFPTKPDAGVKVPHTGTIIEVVSQNTDDQFMIVHVRPAD